MPTKPVSFAPFYLPKHIALNVIELNRCFYAVSFIQSAMNSVSSFEDCHTASPSHKQLVLDRRHLTTLVTIPFLLALSTDKITFDTIFTAAISHVNPDTHSLPIAMSSATSPLTFMSWSVTCPILFCLAGYNYRFPPLLDLHAA